MTATRTLPKQGRGAENFDRKFRRFFEKTFAKGKKLKTRSSRPFVERAFSPNTAARTVPDLRRIPCCASLATRRPRPQKADVREIRFGGGARRAPPYSFANEPSAETTEPRSRTSANVPDIMPQVFVLSSGGEKRLRRRRTPPLRGIFFGGCKTFEFRGEFVLLDFVVHCFFAYAEFAGRESTTTSAGDERFEKSEPFDLRQRQTGEPASGGRRNGGAIRRVKRD